MNQQEPLKVFLQHRIKSVLAKEWWDFVVNVNNMSSDHASLLYSVANLCPSFQNFLKSRDKELSYILKKRPVIKPRIFSGEERTDVHPISNQSPKESPPQKKNCSAELEKILSDLYPNESVIKRKPRLSGPASKQRKTPTTKFKSAFALKTVVPDKPNCSSNSNTISLILKGDNSLINKSSTSKHHSKSEKSKSRDDKNYNVEYAVSEFDVNKNKVSMNIKKIKKIKKKRYFYTDKYSPCPVKSYLADETAELKLEWIKRYKIKKCSVRVNKLTSREIANANKPLLETESKPLIEYESESVMETESEHLIETKQIASAANNEEDLPVKTDAITDKSNSPDFVKSSFEENISLKNTVSVIRETKSSDVGMTDEENLSLGIMIADNIPAESKASDQIEEIKPCSDLKTINTDDEKEIPSLLNAKNNLKDEVATVESSCHLLRNSVAPKHSEDISSSNVRSDGVSMGSVDKSSSKENNNDISKHYEGNSSFNVDSNLVSKHYEDKSLCNANSNGATKLSEEQSSFYVNNNAVFKFTEEISKCSDDINVISKLSEAKSSSNENSNDVSKLSEAKALCNGNSNDVSKLSEAQSLFSDDTNVVSKLSGAKSLSSENSNAVFQLSEGTSSSNVNSNDVSKLSEAQSSLNVNSIVAFKFTEDKSSCSEDNGVPKLSEPKSSNNEHSNVVSKLSGGKPLNINDVSKLSEAQYSCNINSNVGFRLTEDKSLCSENIKVSFKFCDDLSSCIENNNAVSKHSEANSSSNINSNVSKHLEANSPCNVNSNVVSKVLDYKGSSKVDSNVVSKLSENNSSCNINSNAVSKLPEDKSSCRVSSNVMSKHPEDESSCQVNNNADSELSQDKCLFRVNSNAVSKLPEEKSSFKVNSNVVPKLSEDKSSFKVSSNIVPKLSEDKSSCKSNSNSLPTCSTEKSNDNINNSAANRFWLNQKENIAVSEKYKVSDLSKDLKTVYCHGGIVPLGKKVEKTFDKSKHFLSLKEKKKKDQVLELSESFFPLKEKNSKVNGGDPKSDIVHTTNLQKSTENTNDIESTSGIESPFVPETSQDSVENNIPKFNNVSETQHNESDKESSIPDNNLLSLEVTNTSNSPDMENLEYIEDSEEAALVIDESKLHIQDVVEIVSQAVETEGRSDLFEGTENHNGIKVNINHLEIDKSNLGQKRSVTSNNLAYSSVTELNEPSSKRPKIECNLAEMKIEITNTSSELGNLKNEFSCRLCKEAFNSLGDWLGHFDNKVPKCTPNIQVTWERPLPLIN